MVQLEEDPERDHKALGKPGEPEEDYESRAEASDTEVDELVEG